MSDDDYIDYCIMEAIFVRVAREAEDARKKAEREAWKKRPAGGH